MQFNGVHGRSLPQFHSLAQVAEICEVSTKTVRRWIAGGELVAHRLGRQLRVSATDLEVFLKLRRQP